MTETPEYCGQDFAAGVTSVDPASACGVWCDQGRQRDSNHENKLETGTRLDIVCA